MKKKIQQLLKFIPLILFVGYYSCISFFTHTHYINQVLVVHSHPFSSSDNHQHSAAGFQLIQSMAHFVAGALTFAGILMLSKYLIACIKPAKPTGIRLKAFYYSCFLRPPPSGTNFMLQ